MCVCARACVRACSLAREHVKFQNKTLDIFSQQINFSRIFTEQRTIIILAARRWSVQTGIISGSCHKFRFCRDKSVVATKHVFCRDKSMLAATRLLSRQKYACCELPQVSFLSRQKCCRDKTRRAFVATKVCLLRAATSIVFVATKVLSRQNTSFVATKVCLLRAATSIIFVATNMRLSRQNTSFVATKVCLQRQNFCRYKIMFVATKYFCRDRTFFCCDRRLVLSRETRVCRQK